MSFSVPKKTKILWQLRFAAVVMILCAAVASFSPLSKWLWLPCGIIGLLGILLIFVYLPAYFANCRITVGDDAVMVTRGVFIRTTHIMPYPRMIYVSSFSSPIARRLGICAVVMRAARGFILVPEIKIKDVEMISKKAEGTSDG